jgi:hypothetical protein
MLNENVFHWFGLLVPAVNFFCSLSVIFAKFCAPGHM